MFNFFKKNWQLKLLAVVGAIILWIYVANVGYRVDLLNNGLELKAKNVATGYAAVYNQDKVQLKMRAPAASFETVNNSDFEAYIDCDDLDEGVYNLDVKIFSKDSSLQIVEIFPKKVEVRIEQEISEEKETAVLTEGSPKAGFEVIDPEISVDRVIVSGPRSLVNKTEKVVAKIVLQGETTEISQEVKLTPVDNSGQEILNINVVPESALVIVPIKTKNLEKTVEVRADIQGEPADGYSVGKISVEPASVRIDGEEEKVSGIGYLKTLPIDIAGAKNTITKTIGLLTPEGISLIDQQVQIIIEINEVNATKDITGVEIKTTNLAADYKVSSMEPSLLVIKVKGQSSRLENITKDDFVAAIDLKGLTEGEHVISLGAANITAPEGVIVENLNTGSVKVVIEKKK